MKLQDAVAKYVEHLEGRNLSDRHVETVVSRLNRFVLPSKEFPADRRERDVSTIGRDELREHFRRLKAGGRSDGTMAGYTSTHKAFWNYLKRKRLITKKPSRKLKKYSYDPVHHRSAPAENVQKVIASLSDFVNHRNQNPRDVRDALAVSLVVDCGGRLGEVRTLLRRDLEVALAQGRVTGNGRIVYSIVGHGKTGASALRFFSETADLAHLWLKVDPWPNATYVFVNTRTGELLHRTRFTQAFERVCQFAGVPIFRSHALRKRNVTDILRLTGDLKTGQLYANHKSPEVTTRHYDDIYKEDVDDAAAKLASQRRGDLDLISQFFRKTERPK